MKCTEIIKNIENWAPKEIAWSKDNVGLQIGNVDNEIKNILLCLEINASVIEHALKHNCNFIISHHPFFFSPVKRIDLKNDSNSRLIQKLIKKDITLYSAHTNLDYAKKGVSYQLAQRLELQNINFLLNLPANQYKISVFVPQDKCDQIADAIFNAGGGTIGEYSKCSFSSYGIGTFQGSNNSKPAVGQKKKFTTVNEVKLEILVESWKLNDVLSQLKMIHPYEEIAYDVIPLQNPNVNYGIGAMGYLKKEYNTKDFLTLVSDKLVIKNFRYSKGSNQKINKVAVCGGSGSEYYFNAISKNCDAFITADIKYHTFQDAQNKILLIDAGHYETEIFALKELKKRIAFQINNSGNIKVLLYKGSTNPVIFYN